MWVIIVNYHVMKSWTCGFQGVYWFLALTKSKSANFFLNSSLCKHATAINKVTGLPLVDL